MQRIAIRILLAGAALTGAGTPARGQEQAALAERAVNLALSGHCTEAMPLLKQAVERIHRQRCAAPYG